MRGRRLIAVRVHPRASRPTLKWDGELLDLWVHQPPAEGAANDAVLRAVSSWLGVSRSRLELVSGRTSRRKVIALSGDVVIPPPQPG